MKQGTNPIEEVQRQIKTWLLEEGFTLVEPKTSASQTSLLIDIAFQEPPPRAFNYRVVQPSIKKDMIEIVMELDVVEDQQKKFEKMDSGKS